MHSDIGVGPTVVGTLVASWSPTPRSPGCSGSSRTTRSRWFVPYRVVLGVVLLGLLATGVMSADLSLDVGHSQPARLLMTKTTSELGSISPSAIG